MILDVFLPCFPLVTLEEGKESASQDGFRLGLCLWAWEALFGQCHTFLLQFTTFSSKRLVKTVKIVEVHCVNQVK